IIFIWLFALLSPTSSQEPARPQRNDETSSQKRQAEQEKRIPFEKPPEILQVLNEANAAPPEFGADVLIRRAQSERVRDKVWKREMLEEAFRLASKSEQQVKRTYSGSQMDTREGYLALALTQNLDALSLQSRTVLAMLAVDKKRARAMFSEISPDLKLPTLNCEDALVPDVSGYYDRMQRVARETFTSAEIRESAVLWFAQRYTESLTSPVQVGPLAKAISALNLPSDQLTVLLRSFCDSLKRTTEDYRA